MKAKHLDLNQDKKKGLGVPSIFEFLLLRTLKTKPEIVHKTEDGYILYALPGCKKDPNKFPRFPKFLKITYKYNEFSKAYFVTDAYEFSKFRHETKEDIDVYKDFVKTRNGYCTPTEYIAAFAKFMLEMSNAMFLKMAIDGIMTLEQAKIYKERYLEKYKDPNHESVKFGDKLIKIVEEREKNKK